MWRGQQGPEGQVGAGAEVDLCPRIFHHGIKEQIRSECPGSG